MFPCWRVLVALDWYATRKRVLNLTLYFIQKLFGNVHKFLALDMLKRYSMIVPMNRLTTAKRVAVISALVEGCSVRSTSRLTGVAKGTILRLLADVGAACARYQDTAIRNVPARRVQIDEIWSFVGASRRT